MCWIMQHGFISRDSSFLMLLLHSSTSKFIRLTSHNMLKCDCHVAIDSPICTVGQIASLHGKTLNNLLTIY